MFYNNILKSNVIRWQDLYSRYYNMTLKEIKEDLKEVHAISMHWKTQPENLYSLQSVRDSLPSWSKSQQVFFPPVCVWL